MNWNDWNPVYQFLKMKVLLQKKQIIIHLLYFFRYLWPSIVKWSQKLSKGTDYLRIDYFINTKTLEIFASEMNTFPWPESQFFGEKFIEVQKEAYLLGMTKIL